MWPELLEPVQAKVNRPAGFERIDAPLAELIEKRLYVDIVEKTGQLIASTPEPTTNQELEDLLALWLTRFRALLATRQGSLVAQEAQSRMKNLEELAPSASAWDLRVLLIPVWASGINQTAIQHMYQMAIEARTQLMAAKDTDVWTTRLRRLGIDVVAALIGMRDFPTAINHLKSIYYGESYGSDIEYTAHVASMVVLCYIYVGDTSLAREWLPKTGHDEDQTTQLLLAFANEQYEEVIASPGSSPILHNLRALSFLHIGNVQDSVAQLELALESSPSVAILFNLYMLYDLINSPAVDKKNEMAAKLASSHQALSSYDLLIKP